MIRTIIDPDLGPRFVKELIGSGFLVLLFFLVDPVYLQTRVTGKMITGMQIGTAIVRTTIAKESIASITWPALSGDLYQRIVMLRAINRK